MADRWAPRSSRLRLRAVLPMPPLGLAPGLWCQIRSLPVREVDIGALANRARDETSGVTAARTTRTARRHERTFRFGHLSGAVGTSPPHSAHEVPILLE